MSRDIDIDPRETAPVARIHRDEPVEPVPAGYRQPVECRGRTYRLRPSEHVALQHVGTFRVVNARDLQEFLYAGNRTMANQDLRSLTGGRHFLCPSLSRTGRASTTSPRSISARMSILALW